MCSLTLIGICMKLLEYEDSGPMEEEIKKCGIVLFRNKKQVQEQTISSWFLKQDSQESAQPSCQSIKYGKHEYIVVVMGEWLDDLDDTKKKIMKPRPVHISLTQIIYLIFYFDVYLKILLLKECLIHDFL